MAPHEFFRQKYVTVADVIASGYLIDSMQSGNDRARADVTDRLDGPVPKPGNALIEHADKVLVLVFDTGAQALPPHPENDHA